MMSEKYAEQYRLDGIIISLSWNNIPSSINFDAGMKN